MLLGRARTRRTDTTLIDMNDQLFMTNTPHSARHGIVGCSGVDRHNDVDVGSGGDESDIFPTSHLGVDLSSLGFKDTYERGYILQASYWKLACCFRYRPGRTKERLITLGGHVSFWRGARSSPTRGLLLQSNLSSSECIDQPSSSNPSFLNNMCYRLSSGWLYDGGGW